MFYINTETSTSFNSPAISEQQTELIWLKNVPKLMPTKLQQ